jgi:hypothetical protein
MAHIGGVMIKPTSPTGVSNEEEIIDVTVLFENFVEAEPSPFAFNPPSDIW